jgi:hypothetical protein
MIAVLVSAITVQMLQITEEGSAITVQVSRMYFFLLHLSLADILTAFFSLLPEILWTLTLPEFYGGNLLCRTMKFLQVSF